MNDEINSYNGHYGRAKNKQYEDFNLTHFDNVITSIETHITEDSFKTVFY